MLKAAREFAIAAHGQQKYGVHPYSLHLDAVAAIAKPYGEAAEVIAYLHDVVEDTPVTLAQVEQLFGNLVARCVAILSDEPGATRAERKSKTYAKMAKVGGDENLALLVKAADRLANTRASIMEPNPTLIAIYKSEYATFKAAAYRANLCEDIWRELERLQNA